MAKGQSQAAQAQIDANTARQNQLFGIEMPAIQNQIQNPGYDTATQNAIIGQGMRAGNSAYDAAAQSAGNRVAATRNAAGANGLQDELARGKSISSADAAQKAQIEIAQNKQKQQQQGITDASQLFGINTETMPGLLQGRAAGGNPWFDLAGKGIGALGTYFAGKK